MLETVCTIEYTLVDIVRPCKKKKYHELNGTYRLQESLTILFII